MKAISSTFLLISIVIISAFAIFSEQDSQNKAAGENAKVSEAKSYILQGSSAQQLTSVVANVGGDVSREFPIINAISANLTDDQVSTIRRLGSVRVQDDRTVMTMNSLKSFFIDNNIAKQLNAHEVHKMGIKGQNVTVAILDSGANIGGNIGSFLFADSQSRVRLPLKYDAFTQRVNYVWNDDLNGHGTHVATIIGSSFRDGSGNFNSIAPDVNFIPVKAFDHNGNSSYSKVLDALNWIFENRNQYAIRVVNMSLGADAISHYWQDPINQAVMRLWDAGVVVVVSAGNNGNKMGITVPGNTPYVLTVGAATDSGTPLDLSDDRVATFSAQGPTVEGFMKPDVVAYGTNIAAKMDDNLFIRALKKNLLGENYSEISGTSQAAALVTGVAALVLSNDPSLTPDDVKCRITSSARVATEGSALAISPFKQGAGLVDAYAAVMSSEVGCANRGLDIKQDIAEIQHFQGPVRIDENGKYYIQTQNGTTLREGVHWDVDNNTQAPTQARYVRISALSEVNGNPWSSAAEINLLDAEGKLIDRSAWTVTASNSEVNYDAFYAIDGNPSTIWHTEWFWRSPAHTHTFTIDMGSVQSLSALRYLSRQDGNPNGSIGNYEIHFSDDGINWSQAVVAGTLVGPGLHIINFQNDGMQKVNLAASANLDTSYVAPWGGLAAIVEGIQPTWSKDTRGGVYGNYRGEYYYNKYEWVSFSWDTPKTISSFEVYWYMDYQGVLQPTDARVEYWDGDDWRKIDDITTSLHTWNKLDFDPITTSKIRVNMRSSKSTGILEVRVMGHDVVNLEGMHWSRHSMNLEGMHWGRHTMNLDGMHWSGHVMNLEGMHWSREVMGLQGTHWGEEVLGLLGMHWSREGVSIQSYLGENTAIGVQGVYVEPEPLIPSVNLEVDLSNWNQ